MVGRSGIFEGEDPFAIARRWLDEARAQEPNDPDAAALATVDADGLPNVRVVLMRGFEPDAFVFYTNRDSAKGRELDGAGKAAFVIHWKSLRRQIRVRGPVSRVSDDLADAYFEFPPASEPGRRLGLAAIPAAGQPRGNAGRGRPPVGRSGAAPPRPPYWGGYRIYPVEIEFWADGAYRLHDRFRWTRPDPRSAWEVQRLWP